MYTGEFILKVGAEDRLDSQANGRDEMLQESFTLSLRRDNWKYIAPFDGTTPGWLANKTAIENGLQSGHQLFDLSQDKFEQKNVAEQFPQIVKELNTRIEQIIALK
jgi:hypothetical protein